MITEARARAQVEVVTAGDRRLCPFGFRGPGSGGTALRQVLTPQNWNLTVAPRRVRAPAGTSWWVLLCDHASSLAEALTVRFGQTTQSATV